MDIDQHPSNAPFASKSSTRKIGRGRHSEVAFSHHASTSDLSEKAAETSLNQGSAQKSIEGWVLFVTGVHEEATEDDFVDLFSEYGTVKDVRLPLDHRTGYIKGYALVEYPTLAEARAAISALEGSIFLDYTLHVSFAFSKGQTKRLNKE
ncbi:hypothetical protein MDAP_000138 [Mitosporidium daphniae]